MNNACSTSIQAHCWCGKDRALVGVGAGLDEKGDGMEWWEKKLKVQIRKLGKDHQDMLAEGHEDERGCR
jgi:hypothetical protein